MPDALARTATDSGVDVRLLPADLALAEEPARFLVDGMLDGIDVVLSDHYGIAAQWQRAVAGNGRRIAAIDDLAESRMAVHLLVNQNLSANQARIATLVPSGAAILAGPRYALVRPAFAEAAARRADRSGEVRRLLVFVSGGDEHDVTSRATAAADTAVGAGAIIDVVVGSAYPFLERLRIATAARPEIHLHVDTLDMPALMAAADLAFGAPGSASWERCVLGLPSILVILANNQVQDAALLDRVGAALTLGWHDKVTTGQMAAAIAALCAEPARVRDMGLAASAITDGRGVARVAAALQALVADTEPRISRGVTQ